MQVRLPVIASILLTLFVASACAVDAVREISLLRQQSNDAIARHDIDAVQSFWDDDYVITVSTGSIERSNEEARQSFAAHFHEFPDVVYIRTPSEITISDAYPLAIEHGTWTGSRTSKNGKIENGGDYTAAWRKTENGWRIYSELFVGLRCKGEDC